MDASIEWSLSTALGSIRQRLERGRRLPCPICPIYVPFRATTRSCLICPILVPFAAEDVAASSTSSSFLEQALVYQFGEIPGRCLARNIGCLLVLRVGNGGFAF